jgi:hypothetical protein
LILNREGCVRQFLNTVAVVREVKGCSPLPVIVLYGYGVNGKLYASARRTYGVSGWFQYTDENGVTTDKHTLAATNNANPDLKWERTGMFNIGVDFGFFNSRLTGTIEYYDKRTSDLIYYYPVSTNRWMAEALLVKLYINWGVYTCANVADYDATTTVNNKLDECVAMCDDIIKSHLFNLDDAYRKKFLYRD